MREPNNSTTDRIIRTQRHVMGWTVFLCNLLALAAALAGFFLWQLRLYAGSWQALQTLQLEYLQLMPLDHPHSLQLLLKARGLEPGTVDVTEELLLIGACFLLFWVLQGIIRAVSAAVWRSRVKTHLQQMTLLAQEARRLGAERMQTPPKVSDLQTAIDQLSPMEKERLHTGDPDLEGLETAINDLLDRMQEAYAQQTRFVSDASHELRTPIAVLKGYADLLERWGKDDPQVLNESVAAIQAEAQRMSRLVDQLLFLARGDSGRTRLTLAAVDLSDLAREVREESAMIHPEHHWVLEAEAPLEITGDRDMLKEALRVLTDNAAKYTPAGKTITLRTVAEGSRARLVVRDQGMGIGAGDLPHVFDRFYRSDPARTRQHGGAGLGLSIADWIARSHGGHLEVTSWEGIGSRFSLVLPLEQEA